MRLGGEHHIERERQPNNPGRLNPTRVGGRRDLQSSSAAECNRTSLAADRTSTLVTRRGRRSGWAGSSANSLRQGCSPSDLEGGASLKTAARVRIPDHSISQLTSCGEVAAHPPHHLVCVLHRPALRAVIRRGLQQ